MQLVDDPRRASVTDLQPPLQQRCAATLMLDAQFRRLAEQLVAVDRIAIVVTTAGIDCFTCADLFQDVRLHHRTRHRGTERLTLGIGTLTLRVVPEHQSLGLLARQVRALQTPRLRLAGWQKEHVAIAQQRFRTRPIQDRAAVDLARHAECDAAGEVRLDQARDHVHAGSLRGEDQVDADRARLLRQHGDRCFHLTLHGHHQVRHFVDDHDDVRQDAAIVRIDLEGDFGIARLLQACAFLHPAIEVLHVAAAVRRQQRIAVLHLEHSPLEHRGRVAIVGDHLVPEMWQRVVHRELDHLRVDHQEAQRGRRVPVDQRRDDGVHAHRLARAGRARDQQVRHLREVGDDRPALQILAQRDRERRARRRVIGMLHDLAECHHLGIRIRHLDPDGALAGNRRDDADAVGAHREREVVRERRELPDLHARGGLHFELRDGRSRRAADQRAIDAERLQCGHQSHTRRVELAPVGIGVPRRWLGEQRRRRQQRANVVIRHRGSFDCGRDALLARRWAELPPRRDRRHAHDGLVIVVIEFVAIISRIARHRLACHGLLRAGDRQLLRLARQRRANVLLDRRHLFGRRCHLQCRKRCIARRCQRRGNLRCTIEQRQHRIPRQRADREAGQPGQQRQPRTDIADELHEVERDQATPDAGHETRLALHTQRKRETDRHQQHQPAGEPEPRPILRAIQPTEQPQAMHHGQHRQKHDAAPSEYDDERCHDRRADRAECAAHLEQAAIGPDREGDQQAGQKQRQQQQAHTTQLAFHHALVLLATCGALTRTIARSTNSPNAGYRSSVAHAATSAAKPASLNRRPCSASAHSAARSSP